MVVIIRTIPHKTAQELFFRLKVRFVAYSQSEKAKL